MFIIIGVLALGLFGISVISLMHGAFEDFLFLALIAVVIIIIFPLVFLALSMLGGKANKKAQGMCLTYEFFESGLAVEAGNSVMHSSGFMSYAGLDYIYESKDAFYLYIPSRQAYILRKIDINVGNALVLRELLMQNLSKDKYRLGKM